MPVAKTIVIIEQDSNILEGIRLILEKINYRVIALMSCQGIKGLHDVDKPDLVIVGIYTPKELGLNILRKIRELHPRVPVIATTVYSNAFTQDEVMEFGANALVIKPFEVKDLKETIDGLLSVAKPA